VRDGELRSLALQFLRGGQKPGKMEFALGYFGRVPIEQPDVMKTYAVIDAYSKSKGIKMGKNDVWTRQWHSSRTLDFLQPILILIISILTLYPLTE
jgi:hypothetical protein